MIKLAHIKFTNFMNLCELMPYIFAGLEKPKNAKFMHIKVVTCLSSDCLISVFHFNVLVLNEPPKK